MKTYNAGWTATKFIASSDDGVEYKCIRGPVGNGKSVLCVIYIYQRSSTQVVSEVLEEGVVRRVRWSKWLIARHTHKALNETTIETWNEWMGDRTQWHNNNAWGRYEEPLPDGTLLRIDLVCHATESSNIMSDLQSLELSGAWINEAIYSPLKVITRVHSRIGRFNPNPQSGVQLRHFPVVMDTNSPDETNWWYRKEVVEKPEHWQFFVCPPALLARKDALTGKVRYIPNRGEDMELGVRPAENVKEIDGGYHDGFHYWLKQVDGADPDEIKKLLLNQFGSTLAGMPVYPEWSDEVHVVRGEIPMQRGMMLLMGMDLGRTPACVIGQMTLDGRLRVMREVTTWNPVRNQLMRVDVGQFFQEYLRPALVEYGFPNVRHVCFCDPAGKNYNEVVSVCAIERLQSFGMNAVPCTVLDKRTGNPVPAYDVGVRIGAVSDALRRNYGGVPALQVSDSCDMLRRGFNGRYCYRRKKFGGDDAERYTDDPDKNDFSHVHDALQYLCLGALGQGADYSRPVDQFGGGGVDPSAFAFDMELF